MEQVNTLEIVDLTTQLEKHYLYDISGMNNRLTKHRMMTI